MNKYKVLIKDTLIFALGNLGSKIILFLLVPLYTNYLSKAEYGTADLIFTFSQLIVPFVTLTINESVIRFALKKNENKESVLLAAFTVLLYSFLLTFLLLPLMSLYQPIASWRFELASIIVLTGFADTEKSYLKAINRNKHYAAISVLQTLVLAMSNLYLLKVCNAGIRGYLAANIIALAFTTVAGFVSGNIAQSLKNATLDKALLKNMIIYSSPLIFNNVSWWVIHSSDKIMIESMINASELGLYTVATKIPSLINVIISIFIQAWGISSIKEVEKETKDNDFFSNVFSAYTMLAFGAAVFLIGFIKLFMNIYVGSSFVEAWKYTPLLLAAAVFYAVSSYYGSMYSALQKTRNNMLTTMICAICNVVLNYIFISIVGTWGAIIGTVASYFILAHIRMINTRKYVKIDISVRYVLNCIILMGEAILVSMDYHVVLIAVWASILFVVINSKEIALIMKIASTGVKMR